MEEYIFDTWKKTLKELADLSNAGENVGVQEFSEQIQNKKRNVRDLNIASEIQDKKYRYIHDDECIVLSAPKIIIGDVDQDGRLRTGASQVIIRGSEVSLQGAGVAGRVETRATNISQIAEDPGIDGYEHVVHHGSTIQGVARTVSLASESNSDGIFLSDGGASGTLSLLSDSMINVNALSSVENLKGKIAGRKKELKALSDGLKQEVDSAMASTEASISQMEEYLQEREKELDVEVDDLRSRQEEIALLNENIEELSLTLSISISRYMDRLSQMLETLRQIKACEKMEVPEQQKFDEGALNTTSISLSSDVISIHSEDGDGKRRVYPGAGVHVRTNVLDVDSTVPDGDDGKKSMLPDDSGVFFNTMNFAVSSYGSERNDKKLTQTLAENGKIALCGMTVHVGAKNMEYTLDDQYKQIPGKTVITEIPEKATFTVETPGVTVSTCSVTDYKTNDNGDVSATFTAAGSFVVRSKEFAFDSSNVNVKDGKAEEPELAAESKFTVTSETMGFKAIDKDKKSAGKLEVNAKEVALKSTDDQGKAVEGSKVDIVAEAATLTAEKTVAVTAKESVSVLSEKKLELFGGKDKNKVTLDDSNTKVEGKKLQVETPMEVSKKVDAKDKVSVGGNVEAKGDVKAGGSVVTKTVKNG